MTIDATPAGRLKLARTLADFRSAAECARHLGVPEVTYRAHENGLRGLSSDAARSYAAALGCTWAWLITGEGPQYGTSPDEVVAEAAAISGLAEAAQREVDFGSARAAAIGAKDLPVHGSAEGGPSGMTVEATPIDWVARPEPLLAVRDAFAVYVVGDSMEPAYRQGDMILVHPTRPPHRGADVLLTRRLEDGTLAAMIKELVRWTAAIWVVRQHNPARIFELDRGEWQQVQVIEGKYNRR